MTPFEIDAVSAKKIGLEDPEETGSTFAENAAIKAHAAARGASLPALSDDSGLAVTALSGAPGIYSARWGGEQRDFAYAMKKVQSALAESGTEDFSARFICALCLAWPDGHQEIFEGEVCGRVVFPPRGAYGFGYDPIFIADGYDITFGEMDPEEKHSISHRADAFRKLMKACMVVNTGANLLLVDSAWNDEATREILRLIREETGKTPDAAIVTHAHDDKMGGMTALHEAGVQSFAFALTNEDAPDRNLVRAMNDFPQSMSGEVHAFTVDERQAHKTGLFWLHPGAGHTRDNIVVYYEPAKILFGGCLIRPGGSGSLGNTADGDVANWANAVRKVATEFPEAEIVIPTHGPKGRTLPGALAPALRSALLRLNRGEAAKAGFERAMRALAGFVKAFKVKYDDVEVSIDIEGEKGLADSGDLDADLGDLFLAIGEAAAERKTAFVLFIDELQYVPEEQLASFIAALHRVSQHQQPVTMVAAGLPQLLGQMGQAKSYAERLFEFIEITQLDEAAARMALINPAQEEGARYEKTAIDEIIRQTQCYPYFLQEWGKHSWDAAEKSPITDEDVEQATIAALAEMDASFFRVRFDRLAPSEKRYLRAMAELGPGAHRSGDIADILKKKVSAVAPTRSNLIQKGMIYSLSHGDNAFTSLRNEALSFLGRDHDAPAAISAITLAQEKFDQVTFDLIYARPDQTADAWRRELTQALAFGPTHLSLYQLTIEPGTAFDAQVRAQRWTPAGDDDCADQFTIAQELTRAAGLPAYEISNHAASGAQSQHNLLYWRYQDYIGVGPGAHGRLTRDGQRIATEMTAQPENYLAGAEIDGTGASLIEPLDDEAQLIERLTMGLRLNEGVTLYADDIFYRDEMRATKLRRAIDDGLIELHCGRLIATPAGRPVLNRVLYELLG
ncbi:dITP/XTP pyrophosphatase (Non-canonical purine NTP pyrophosphatase) (Non-standard purine NTP pyrophosphatase) (Nucleoside-triphosphate diphosphatase) (Nucleoside-triphosphate pyrophosphatase) (NTPase) [Durusdinium trenchii]|uniref:DITP/XTP pyrophosphatase (Non-canonical purine NTP pyrophosphatase) (Non-standard purine NTP pyrophosphatase) (Nucleoside-triphosphate diphosphatase) (Nucleoside-triphosphate pyrophosphatase) (NTPase) n=1 Tax=Durusdinium trenchii TaxID=1381693 RepID=A0ABP0LRS0_9DINO